MPALESTPHDRPAEKSGTLSPIQLSCWNTDPSSHASFPLQSAPIQATFLGLKIPTQTLVVVENAVAANHIDVSLTNICGHLVFELTNKEPEPGEVGLRFEHGQGSLLFPTNVDLGEQRAARAHPEHVSPHEGVRIHGSIRLGSGETAGLVQVRICVRVT